MKTLLLLPLTLAVALGTPTFPRPAQEQQIPLLGDWVPLQGHVVVEHPAPRPQLGPQDQQGDLQPKNQQGDLQPKNQQGDLQPKDQQKDLEPQDQQGDLEPKNQQKDLEPQDQQKDLEPKDQQGDLQPKNQQEHLEPKDQQEHLEPQDQQKDLQPKDQQKDLEPKDQQKDLEPQDQQKDLEPKDQQKDLEPQDQQGEAGIQDEQFKVESEVKVEVGQEAELETEIQDEPEFKVESEVKVEPYPEETLEDEAEEEFHEGETEPDLEAEESPDDMEGRFETMNELKLLGNDEMFGPEDSELLTQGEEIEEEEEEEEELMLGKDSYEQPDMELDPEMMEETEMNPEGQALLMEEEEEEETEVLRPEEPAAQLLEEEEEEELMLGKDPYVQPNMELDPEMMEEKEINPEGQALLMEEEEEDTEVLRPEEPAAELLEEEEEEKEEEEELMLGKQDEQPNMELDPEMMEEKEMNPEGQALLMEEEEKEEDTEVLRPEEPAAQLLEEEEEKEMREQLIVMREGPNGQGRRNCPGVTPDGKCYQFFRGPKNFDDAENFCKQNFPGGHLASITSRYIHEEVKKLILKHTGTYTRAWIGGRRLSQGNGFRWLDGSSWSYAQWLYGEPNNTAGVEDCLEVVGRPYGYGTFNDFTCWEDQAFICSYSLQ